MKLSYKPVHENGKFIQKDIELYPNNSEKEYLEKCFSLYRYVNAALNLESLAYA